MDTELHRERRELMIVGGGGHALVVAEAAEMLGFRLLGFLDDSNRPALAEGAGSATHLGKLAELEALLARHQGANFILAIGHAGTRRAILDRLAKAGIGTEAAARAATIVHPAATVSRSATLGFGVFVGPRAVVHTRAVVGDHAIINSGAIVEHECQIGENVHIAPGAVMGGRAVAEADALVGIGSRVMLGLRIGRGSTVGCGAVVVKHVAPGATVKGVPAR